MWPWSTTNAILSIEVVAGGLWRSHKRCGIHWVAGSVQHKSHSPSWHVGTLVIGEVVAIRVLLVVVVCIKSGSFSWLAYCGGLWLLPSSMRGSPPCLWWWCGGCPLISFFNSLWKIPRIWWAVGGWRGQLQLVVVVREGWYHGGIFFSLGWGTHHQGAFLFYT